MSQTKASWVLCMTSFPPRECGIATFTQDLTDAIDKKYNPNLKTKILAINDNGTNIYNYDKRKILYQINQNDISAYLSIARQINNNDNIKVINIQHEFGLFGGDWGSYLIPFIEMVEKPIIVTFHTVLQDPDHSLKRITQAITRRANGIIVMTENAAKILERQYDVKKAKIYISPHGVHSVPFSESSEFKQKLGLEGRTVLSTFGMLNCDKGIEYAIEALPEVIKKFPDLIYLIIGETHPVVRKEEGEIYRNFLIDKVKSLGLCDYVKFYNKYLALGEIIDYLRATDIYLSPSLNPKQAVSGTLSYAMSCGRPIITTPSLYAKEIVNPDRGILVKLKDSKSITKALLKLLSHPKLKDNMCREAYTFTRHMIWPNVAISYFKIFNKVFKFSHKKETKLPVIKFNHLKNLTDNFGVIQFARQTRPDPYSGYMLDDNSRALLVSSMYYNLDKKGYLEDLMKIYLNFIKFVQRPNGKFYNFVSYGKRIDKKDESEDAFGRALWALGYLICQKNQPSQLRSPAIKIFNKAERWASELKSPRAMAFSLLGLCFYQQCEPDTKKLKLINQLADNLIKSYNKHSDDSWQWFEDYFAYSNSKLPEALFCAYNITGKKKYLAVAEKTLNFFLSITFEKNLFSPIGQDGWYHRHSRRAYFDQQPEDAACLVQTLNLAYSMTKDSRYLKYAQRAFAWFLGRNHLSQMVYDEVTGGCHDGLGMYSLNINQGAESTISYLLARLSIT